MNALGLERSITHTAIYFPRYSELNDPLDCAPVLLPPSPKHVTQYLREHAIQAGFRGGRGRRAIRALHKRLQQPAVLEKLFRDTLDEFGIVSLSADRENLLMWSHYADGHKGVCLEFDVQRLARDVAPVVYAQVRPTLDPTMARFDPEGFTRAGILTKHLGWSYEAEFRIVDRELGERTVPDSALTGVILGARITPQDEQRIRSWVKMRSSPAKLYRAQLNKRKFSLRVGPAV